MSRGRAGRVARWLGRVLAVGGLLVGLAVGGLVATVYLQAQREPAGTGEYVALGSSFAAAPGVGSRAPGSPTACLRSDRNYPQRLAETLGLSLSDVTCGGATIEDVVRGGQYFLPAQVDALRSETSLVTLTVGGNDVAFLGNVTAWACDAAAVTVPRLWRTLGACDVAPDSTVDAALQELPEALEAAVALIRERSPRAEIVLLDYQAVVPESGTCRERLPIADDRLDRAQRVQADLNATIERVAEEHGVGFVSAYRATRGHDVCASDSWITPFSFPPTFLHFGAVPYHPTSAGVEATTRAVEQHLMRRD